MKFLCVQCDAKMNLEETSGPDEEGSLAVVFQCTSCKNQVAMLTNAHETQMVTSLGVKIGAEGEEGKAKCPFSQALSDSGETPKKETSFPWTESALARLSNIPDFVRPMAKTGVEQYAEANGFKEVSEEVLDKARGMFGA